jgi:hypothetical protein
MRSFLSSRGPLTLTWRPWALPTVSAASASAWGVRWAAGSLTRVRAKLVAPETRTPSASALSSRLDLTRPFQSSRRTDLNGTRSSCPSVR